MADVKLCVAKQMALLNEVHGIETAACPSTGAIPPERLGHLLRRRWGHGETTYCSTGATRLSRGREHHGPPAFSIAAGQSASAAPIDQPTTAAVFTPCRPAVAGSPDHGLRPVTRCRYHATQVSRYRKITCIS